MTTPDSQAGSARVPRRRRRSLLSRLLDPWVRIKRDPAEPASLLKPDVPVCYVVERHGLSDALILDRACREAGLPDPGQAIAGLPLRRRRAMFSLGHRPGRSRKNRYAMLRELFEALEQAREGDVQLVPVSIYVGRAPARDTGWFRVLFSEDWFVVGRFRRMLALLLNGRDTVVHFSEPVSLRQALEEAGSPRDDARLSRLTRMIARVLRLHFRRIRARSSARTCRTGAPCWTACSTPSRCARRSPPR